jgi:hypothetical protein
MLTIVLAILIAFIVIATFPSLVAGVLWVIVAIADRRHARKSLRGPQ